MRSAAVHLATSRGVRAITNRAIARRARLLPNEAIRHYASVDGCLAAAYHEGFSLMVEACTPALSSDESWSERLAAACEAAIAVFARRPELGRFCMVEAWRINSPLLARERMVARERSVALLADHCPEESDAELPDLRFELFAGATHHAIGEELQRRDCDPGSIRARFAALIGMFEPARASTAA
jgi:AcrR family transcriptional regulator